MSLQIIFPDENKMKLKKLNNIKDKLNKILLSKNITNEINNLNRYIGKLEGILLVTDRNNLKEYHEYFQQLDFLTLFNDFIEIDNAQIGLAFLSLINFLIINIKNKDMLKYIFETKFKTQIEGIRMNLIDKIISLDTKNDEEYLTQQINFMKSLSLKLDIDNLKYFYNSDINQFQILTKSLSLFKYSNSLIRVVVKNIFLNIIKIQNKNLREFLTSFPINIYYSNIIFNLKNSIVSLFDIDFENDIDSKVINKLKNEHDIIIDTILYINDLFSLNIDKVNFILINSLLNEIIFPLISILIDKNQHMKKIYQSLYILCLILYKIKNKFLSIVISHFLFNDKIPNNISAKLSNQTLEKVDRNLMEDTNFLIANYLYADVNDGIWQNIKNLMKRINGVDLSTGETDINNLYDFIKNNIMKKNQNEKNDNKIFKAIKELFICNEEDIILILNLIIYCYIKSYKNFEEKKNKDEDDNNFSLINNKKQQNNFFNLDLYDEKSNNIINMLFNFIISNKIYKLATYEIIIDNIRNFTNIILEKNNNEKSKKLIQIKLLKLFDDQYDKIKAFQSKNSNLNKYIFEYYNKAYDYFIKNEDQKINDLIILPNILIPNIFVEKYDFPEYLKEDKFIKNHIFNILYINNIIHEIMDNKKNKIKSNDYTLSIKTIKFINGKIYKVEELGDDYVHCRILINNKLAPCQAILSANTLYLGEVLSGNFIDLSKVKIFKQIQLRYLEIMQGEDECTLNIIDNSLINKKNIIMNCLTPNNTKAMFNYLSEHILLCQNLEKTIFDSFIDNIHKKLHENLI